MQQEYLLSFLPEWPSADLLILSWRWQKTILIYLKWKPGIWEQPLTHSEGRSDRNQSYFISHSSFCKQLEDPAAPLVPGFHQWLQSSCQKQVLKSSYPCSNSGKWIEPYDLSTQMSDQMCSIVKMQTWLKTKQNFSSQRQGIQEGTPGTWRVS